MIERDLADSSRTAAVAELAYFENGGLRSRRITPLLLDESLAFTLTYADANLAERLQRSPEVCVVFSDSRLARVGWKPLAATLTLRMTPDIEGDLFNEELLDQELLKYPPDRRLLDNMLLRRENWWCIPRLVFCAAEVREVRPVERRTDPDHAVLAFEHEDGISADTVRVGEWETERVPLASLSGGDLPPSRRAALHAHDFSVPDMEQSSSFLATGQLQNGRLAVENREGERELGEPSGLIGRWRAHKALERACKAGIKARELRGRA